MGMILMDKRAVIIPDKCKICKLCKAREVCPAKAVEQEEPDEPYYINAFCQGCGKCIVHCPHKAVIIV